MDFKKFYAGTDDLGRRLDRILRRLIPGTGLSETYSLLRKGLVKVNGKKSTPDARINPGDEIQIASFIMNRKDSSCGAQNTTEKYGSGNLNIIFHNRHLLFIEKPYGKTVHGKKDSLDIDVRNFYSGTPVEKSLSFRPGPLHRLDERTTGILAFSWSLEGARWFSDGIRTHSIKKEYVALVQGHMTESRTWRDLIDAEEKDDFNGFKKVRLGSGKESVTRVFPLSNGISGGVQVSLVKFAIETGRTHQIRAQSAAHGFPLAGDTAYGAFEMPAKTERKLFLHASRLILPENTLGVPETIFSPLPEPFMQILKTSNCETPDLSL